MNQLHRPLTLATLILLPLAAGCGLEELILGAVVGEPVVETPIPGSVPEGAGQLRGEIPGALGEVTLSFYGPQGALLESQDVEIDYTKTPIAYSAVVLPTNRDALFNIRVVAESGGVIWKAIVADPVTGGAAVEVDLDAASTTLALALEMKPVPRDGAVPEATPTPTPPAEDAARATVTEDAPPALASFPCDGVDLFFEDLSGQLLAGSGPAFELFVAVTAAIDSGATSWPAVVDEAADLSGSIATLAVAAGRSASADGTLADGRYRVFMGVIREQGYPDHNCYPVDIDKWVNPDAGDSMFIVGGIHEDSPIQDATIQNDVLPNWVPNTLPMFNDGTHGDTVAGDNLWVRSFVFPTGLRIGYKYTFGAQGQNWTGTEEWPGNQRLLEIEDVNGDGVVARFDIFADERSNKDKQNSYIPGGTAITWDTDLNGDGYSEAKEMPANLDGVCGDEGFWQPLSLPPVTAGGCLD